MMTRNDDSPATWSHGACKNGGLTPSRTGEGTAGLLAAAQAREKVKE